MLLSEALAEVAARGWALSYSPPPYEKELRLPAPPYRPRSYSLLILDIPTTGQHTAECLRPVVSTFRRKLVVPVFARPAGAATLGDLLRLRGALLAAGAEFLPPGDQIGSRARDVLTLRSNLASDWIGWWRLHEPVGPLAEMTIRALVNYTGNFNHTAEVPHVDEILELAEVNPRSARRYLKEAGLPPPRAWALGTRLLRALLNLQRDSDLDVLDVAIAAGYSDPEYFSNALRRYFGHGMPEGRDLLGIEGRFHEFRMLAG